MGCAARGPETPACHPGRLREGVVALLPQHVNACDRKVVEPAGMVEVEVGEHDVLHVCSVVAQALDLAHGRHLLAEVGAQQLEEEPARP